MYFRFITRPDPKTLLRVAGWLAAVGWVALAVPCAADEKKVTVSGGVDASGSYRWTITNYYDSPIVFVQFGHYHGDMFLTPPGWKREATYLVNVGVPDRPGVCTAWVDSPKEGIPRYGSAEFGLRMAVISARVGKGEFLIRFADGTSTVVTGVTLPVAPEKIESYAGLIGFALLFAGLVGLELRRRLRARRAMRSASAGAAAPLEPADPAGQGQ